MSERRQARRGRLKGAVPVLLRLPPSIVARAEAAADAWKLSRNLAIIRVLNEHLPKGVAT